MCDNHNILVKADALRCLDSNTSFRTPEIAIFLNRHILALENMGQFWPKNREFMNFQFLINQPIRPIFIICKLDQVSLGIFNPFPRYQTYNLQNGQKIGFFYLNYGFWAYFETSICGFLVEISAGVEISTVKNISKKTYNVCADPL